MLDRLFDVLKAYRVNGISPLDGSKPIGPGNVRLFFEPGTPQATQDTAGTVLGAFDWSDKAQVDWTLVQRRQEAKALIQITDPNHPLYALIVAVRAGMKGAQNGINENRQRGGAPLKTWTQGVAEVLDLIDRGEAG
jgi:hypothetical protein